MIKKQHIIFVLLPAVLLVGIIFSIRAFQYKILFSDKTKEVEKKTTLELIPILKEDPILGSLVAPHTLIAFEDFGCEGCKSQNILLKEIEQKHPGKVKMIWKGLPVVTFPFSSEPAHEYGYCANAQGKFTEFKELAFANSNNLSKQMLDTITKEIKLDETKLKECLSSEKPLQYINTIRQLARIVHVQHVPTFFLNNKQISTPASLAEWEFVLGL